MSGTIGYEDIRAGTARQVAQLMAAAAITAPKSGGQLFPAGKPNFLETVITDDTETPAGWQPGCGHSPRGDIGDSKWGRCRTVPICVFTP